MTAGGRTSRAVPPRPARRFPPPPSGPLAELDRDWGDEYDVDAACGWWWAVLRRTPGYVIKAKSPGELRALLEDDHERRTGRRVP